MNNKKNILFISGHYYPSARRAGFHHLADAAHKTGHGVTFVTAGYSLLSYLRRDFRTRIPGIAGQLNKAVEIKPGFTSYVYFTPWHPVTFLLPWLNRGTMRFMDRYGQGNLGALLPLVRKADVFVFESMCGLFLFSRFKREAPLAKTVYRVSDDIRVLRSTHPRLVEAEQEIAGLFDRISVPSRALLQKFEGLPNTQFDPHGLDTSVYDSCNVSPYPKGTKNAVFVGSSLLDVDFLAVAAEECPDCRFHIIGNLKKGPQCGNITYYGELPFRETVPYIKFADCGLQIMTIPNPLYAYLAESSLKALQYRYCGLPIVAPDLLSLNGTRVAYYSPGIKSTYARALRAALAQGRGAPGDPSVLSWDEVLNNILKEPYNPALLGMPAAG